MAQSSDLEDLSSVSTIIKSFMSLGTQSFLCHPHRMTSLLVFGLSQLHGKFTPYKRVLMAAQTSWQHSAFKEQVLFSFINLPILNCDFIYS